LHVSINKALRKVKTSQFFPANTVKQNQTELLRTGTTQCHAIQLVYNSLKK